MTLVTLSYLFFLGTAHAADITVDTTQDDFGTNLNNCSLREAIQSVNILSDFGGCVATGTYGVNDTIDAPAGDYALTIDPNPSQSNNDNASGDLDICPDDVIINGAGIGQTVIRANFTNPDDSDRVIQTWYQARRQECIGQVQALGGVPVIEINGVTVRDGRPNSSATFFSIFGGGGILNTADLTLNDSEVTNNTASNETGEPDEDVYGGGILNFGTLRINRSLIQNNLAFSESLGTSPGFFSLGGGIATGGIDITTPFVLEVTDTNINNNRAENGSGGGIATFGIGTEVAESVLVLRSAVYDNQAVVTEQFPVLPLASPFFGSGGGVAHLVGNEARTAPQGASGFTFRFVDSTLSMNSAPKDGGGFLDATVLAAQAPEPGVTQILSSTVAENTGVQSGGGIKRHRTIVGTTLQMLNTILANNTATLGPDCNSDDPAEPITSEGYNLIRDRSDCTINGPGTGDLPDGTNPMLGTLVNNGGITPTHALVLGSPAVDTARPEGDGGCVDNLNAGAPLPWDQRNDPFDRVVAILDPNVPRCDIGAFELQVIPTPSPTPTPTGLCLSGSGNPWDTIRADCAGCSLTSMGGIAGGVMDLGILLGMFLAFGIPWIRSRRIRR